MEIQFEKPSMKYKPGQWLFLNCPEVSGGQWHPFTITSCPFDPYISVHVRQVGDFTRDLADALGTGPQQKQYFDELEEEYGTEGMECFDVQPAMGEGFPRLRVDGPYGAPAEDVFANEVAVLIGTGIGVTPFASILKHIYNLRAQSDLPKRLRRVEFFWICRDTSSFMWFQSLLISLETQSLNASDGMGDDFLRIHTYLTKQMNLDEATEIILGSVGTEKDPLTELRSRTNYGRPNFKKLLPAMRNGIIDQRYMPNLGTPSPDSKNKNTEVGVYFCGPSAASRDIKKACQIADSKEVKFKFWKEHF
jgi:NADPH oxidase